jgi:hypothetical protein
MLVRFSQESEMTRLRYLPILAILVCVAFSNAGAQESQRPGAPPALPLQYAATAFGQAGAAAGKSFGLTVRVEGVTSSGEIDELIATLKQKGQDGVVSAMENMKDIGRVSPTGSVGTGMRVVRIRPGKTGGWHIVLATNRPITFGELYNGTRSRDYPIGIVVLDVDANGKGTGTFAPLCKVKFNKKHELEIENYGQKPFRLANVYLQK